MPQLPTVGGSDGQWGQMLNDFLSVEHDPNTGQLRSSGTVGQKYTLPSGGVPESDLSSSVQTKLNTVGSGSIADGSVTTAKLAANAVTNAQIADGALSQAKISGVSAMGNAIVFLWNGSTYADPTTRFLATSANAAPVEFRGPTDPATISGIIVKDRDTWVVTS